MYLNQQLPIHTQLVHPDDSTWFLSLLSLSLLPVEIIFLTKITDAG